MYTEEAKEIAEERLDQMDSFFSRLEKEIGGDKLFLTSQCPGEDLPGQGGFRYKAENYIHLLTVKVILPRTYFFIL